MLVLRASNFHSKKALLLSFLSVSLSLSGMFQRSKKIVYPVMQHFLAKNVNSLVMSAALFSTLNVVNCDPGKEDLFEHDKSFLFIEGNNASGKTSLANILQQKLGAVIVPEPIERWQNLESNENLLDIYHSDHKRWGYTFQSYAALSYVQELLAEKQSQELLIADRSLFSAFYGFARMLQAEGSLTNLEFELLRKQFMFFCSSFSCNPDGIIYLRTTPKICWKRSASRNRQEESCLPLSFFELLNQYHEEWLIEKKVVLASHNEIPVLILDGDLDFINDKEVQANYMEKIENFINRKRMLSDLESSINT